MRTQAAAAPVVASRPALVALCVAAFFAAMNYFAPSPFYADIAADLDTTVPLLGQLVTAMLLTSAALGLVVGPLADRYGIRELLILGMAAIALNLLGTAAAPAYPWLIPLAMVGALGDALVFGLSFALASSLFTAETRRRAIGWTMASISVGPVAGVPILTLIGGASGWRVALGLAGALAVAATWLTIVALPVDRRRPSSRLRLRVLLQAYAPILEHAPTKRLLGVAALRAVWMLGLVTYIGAYLRDDLDLSTERVGLYYLAGGIGSTVGSLAGGSRIAAIRPRPTIAALNLAGGGLVALVLLSSAQTALVAMPLVTMIGVMASVAITAMLAGESPAEPGTTMALGSSLLNLGAALGASAGGVLIAAGGYGALALGLPVFALAAAVLVLWPERRSVPGRSLGRS